ncbi:MAG: GNAT family N-acetyltransferase, partial [Chitinophagia bacterium]|nr:GNAT family N-acetyltransferase [Chitinophagia bacterium]
MLLAPNGKQSNLTKEQYKLVRTPQFKAWFGDWENDPQNASKVVDANGEPMVVYHGTDRKFTKFNKSLIGSASGEENKLNGFYFTSDYDTAKFYAEYYDEQKNYIMSCFLNLRKPIIKSKENPLGIFSLIENAFENNNDGVIIKSVIDSGRKSNQIIAFESNQIKLASGENTTFDANNDDIRYAKGGRTIAQTPAPKKDRIYGSKVNKVGSASSEKSAKSIVLSKKIIDSLKDKLLVFKKKHPSKTNITIDDLKAVYRRGLGAYSSSHRPTISGGVPNTRNAWAMARVNKFLLKAGGTKVKKAYVQDDDLMEYGGEVAPFNTKTIVSSQSDFQNSFKITLLTKNDDVIGTFAYYIDNEDYTPHHSVEVNPKYRGLGFGKELLLKAIKVANDYELGFSSDSSMTLDQKRVYDSLERDGLISGYLGTFSLTDKGEDYLMENELDMYAKGGKVVVDEKEMLKFKKIGISDVYEIEAIKDIGLQGFNFDKQTILDVINKRFNSLLVGYDDYLVDEDSEAITRAIQNDIDARKEQGDSLENIKMFESYLTNDAQRQRYLDSYRNTQQSTILEWVNYLKQSEYDEAFKYLMLKSVLEYNYDFKTNKLIERTNKTLRNFTNFDAGTLSEIYAQNSKYLLKDYVELQVKNVDAIIKSKNLVKESKDGYWIKFDGGSEVSQEQRQKNAKELSQLVQNTYWCTKTNAKSQLDDGDFYVYVTKSDKELLPRIAIRMEGDRVGEVRGNKSSSQD